MSRWPPDPRERLERASLELFTEQGFAETTVPQITARAGLGTRTFFRHFADKRAVLFAWEEELPALVAQVMADAPAGLDPMGVIAHGLGTIASTRFESRQEYLRTHRAVVQADEGLRERELRKQSILSEAIRQGFLDRGLDPLSSVLAAQIAVTVLSVALTRWLDQTTPQPLPHLVEDTMTALRAVTAEPPSNRTRSRAARPSQARPGKTAGRAVRRPAKEAPAAPPR